MLQVPAGFARGKELRLKGMIRTGGLVGHAYLELAAWGDRVVPAADTGSVNGGDAEWHEVNLTIQVPADPSIHSIVLVPGVQGAGTAWFDGFVLQLNGTPIDALPAEVAPPTAKELAWLATRTTALRTVQAPSGQGRPDDRDLPLFTRIVGDARVLGLGESTHGTSEFFQVKHRLVEYLVRTQGFDVFAIEANQVAVERLNAFVLGGAGTARDAMRVMFRVWNTEEMQALVEWMRGYNATHPKRPVRFIGYDMQDQREPADSLQAFLARSDPSFLPRVEALTGDYRARASYITPDAPDSLRGQWLGQGDSLAQEVSSRRGRWLAAAKTLPDSVGVEWAVHEADLYRQAARLNASLFSPDRDSLMASNLAWAISTLYRGSRVIVWAHDVHVSHGGDKARSFNGGAQMGAHLKHSYGLNYRAFSLLTARGEYSATRSFTDHVIISVPAFPAPAGSLEAALTAVPRLASSPGLIADLRVAEGSAEGAWLWRARPVRHVGYAAYDYGFDLQAVMPLEFDGVVFVEQTTASHLLPARP
jgi:erythromycin esterase